MICSKLHCQKGFNRIIFFYEIRRLAQECQAAVLTVDYRQTPEHDRDESVSDIAKAYKWVPCLLNPQPETRNPQRCLHDPQPSTLPTQAPTLNPQPSTSRVAWLRVEAQASITRG